MSGLALFFGCLVGFALGLTGGGGGVFAVPLLVYGLGVSPHEAIGISLAAVGGTAFFGALPRLLRGEVEVPTGLLFAVAGMLGAPIGSYLSTLIPEQLLLVMFGVLMFVVAWRMWVKTNSTNVDGDPKPDLEREHHRVTCRRDETGRLRLTSKCARLLVLVGLGTGILSGMFGVGGGFVIVPALVLFSGMKIHRAVGTSLGVIFLVSVSGVTSHLVSGRVLALDITLMFLLGGSVGMWAGGLVAKRLDGKTLQQIFSVAVVLVAIFVVVKSTMT